MELHRKAARTICFIHHHYRFFLLFSFNWLENKKVHLCEQTSKDLLGFSQHFSVTTVKYEIRELCPLFTLLKQHIFEQTKKKHTHTH